MPRNTLPYPPRPKRSPLIEPSINWKIRLAIAVLGAKRASPPRLMQRLLLSGLTETELTGALARIRTTDNWWRVWHQEAEISAAQNAWQKASAQAFLGQLVLSPFHPQKASLQSKMRDWHRRAREERQESVFEVRTLAGGRLAAYRETPVIQHHEKPTVLLLPPLASTKEELTLLSDPLLSAGFPVVRIDMPGQGESPGPLRLDTESLLSEAMSELGVTQLIAGGLSLGAFFALRLAATDKRVIGAFGVSPPAITTPEEWRQQPEVIWQYLDRYFEEQSRAHTYEQVNQLTLHDLAPFITCPVLLFHGTRDRISSPNASERYRALLGHTELSEQAVNDGHCCLLHLRDTVGPEVARWAAKLCLPTEA